MSVLEQSIWVDADPEQVWRVYADPSRIPDWQTGRPVIGDLHGHWDEPGAGYVSKRGPLSARTTVLTAEAPHRLVTRTDAYLGLGFDVASTLVAEGGGTRLDLRIETQWPRGLALPGRVVELAILNRREMRKELANLKRLIEGEARG